MIDESFETLIEGYVVCSRCGHRMELDDESGRALREPSEGRSVRLWAISRTASRRLQTTSSQTPMEGTEAAVAVEAATAETATAETARPLVASPDEVAGP